MQVSGIGHFTGLNSGDKALWKAAKDLESTFLAEMLKSAGLGKSPSAFGGGIGETQFSSFLRDAQADQMVASGGIGLAEAFFDAMKDLEDGQTSGKFE